MGGKKQGPTQEELEIQRLQKERLAEEQAQAERVKKEQQALIKARRSGGMGGLLQGSETGESGGYSSLLGG
jgi:hypothetical protein